jgi:hypothetical protein
MSLALNDNVILTDLAYEKARRLGMRLISPQATTPPAAPVRPYLSQQNRVGKWERIPSTPADQSRSQLPSEESEIITPLVETPFAVPCTATGLLQPVQESSVDVTIRQKLQQQIGAQFPEMDKVLLTEIIERVLRRFGIG